jgi:hypothetical protein
MKFFPAAALAALSALMMAAQTSQSVAFSVKETTGIRRGGYPVDVRVPFPKGALASASNARVMRNGLEVPAQFTGESNWPDGSVQWLDVDFNASIGPNEAQTYQVEYGSDVKPGAAPRGGLTVSEEDDAIQVGKVRFSKTGSPLLESVKYRDEDLAKGGTGFAVADAAGKWVELKSAEAPEVEVVKRGPLLVMLRYTGRLALDASYTAPYVITVEMPNSKTWVKVSAKVEDPGKKLREISYHTGLALGALPWVWDFGTERWTYGSIRNQSDTVNLTEAKQTSGVVDWQVTSGAAGKEQVYEVGGPGRRDLVRWGHIQDGKETIAFGVEENPPGPGRYQFALNGQGGVAIRFKADAAVTEHQLTVYEHFVTSPVQIGAVTSPTSMLSPLVVDVEGRKK